MATKKQQPVQENLTELNVERTQFLEKLNSRVEAGEVIYEKPITTVEGLEENEIEFRKWSDYNSELLKQSFTNPNNEYRQIYDGAGSWIGAFGARDPNEQLKNLKERIKRKLEELEKLRDKLDLIPTKYDGIQIPVKENNNVPLSNDIFIVHGQDEKIKEEVARTISKLGLNPIILHEQPNAGKTIIEKFEKFSNVRFAVILMTADDEGKSTKEIDLKKRARQNVILELGYFIGKLGRDKICPLYSEGVELPSDLYGIVYVPIDVSGNWKFSLVREMKSAGIDVDANKLI